MLNQDHEHGPALAGHELPAADDPLKHDDDSAEDTGQQHGEGLKRCPFCGASGAELVIAHYPDRYGIRCVACRAYFLPNLETREEAIARWNRRMAGAAGGRATKGITSRRKSRAARHNLKLARRARQIQTLRMETENGMVRLRPIRQAEIAQAEAAAAEIRAQLKAREGQILGDPARSRLYALLKRRQVEAEPGS